MNETQLIELLRSQMAAERDADAAIRRLDEEQERLIARLDAARDIVVAIRKDASWTKYRLMTVIAGKDDPGPDRDLFMQRQADISNRGVP